MSKLIVTSNAPMAGTIFITPINLATAKVATSTFTVFHADDGVDPIEGSRSSSRSSRRRCSSYSMTVQGPDIMVTYGVDYSPDAFAARTATSSRWAPISTACAPAGTRRRSTP